MRTVIALLVLALGNLAQAACPGVSCTYWVDNGCPSNGDGSQRGCATSTGQPGPLKTIQAAIDLAITDQPGANGGTNTKDVTIEIRGPHAASHDSSDCAGTTAATPYNEVISLNAGSALQCAATHRCTIQGCSAASCGTAETAVNSGLKLHSDWSSAGGGIYYRTMEARDDYPWNNTCAPGGGNGVEDSQDPGFVVTGAAPDDTRTFIQSSMNGINDTTPAAGRWSYVTATHRVYVHLSDGSDPATKVWVPDHHSQLWSNGYNCPECSPATSVTCLGTKQIHNVTFRRLVLEGARLNNANIMNHSGYHADNITFENVTMRYAGYQNFAARGYDDLTVTDTTFMYVGRGLHDDASTTGNTMGMRVFDIITGTFTNVMAAHGGEAGLADGGCGGHQDQPANDSPWNLSVNNPYCHGAKGLDIKQSRNITVTNYTGWDLRNGCLNLDSVDGAVVDGGSVSRCNDGITVQDGLPQSPPSIGMRDTIVRNVTFDNHGRDSMGGLYVTGGSIIREKLCIGGNYNACGGASRGEGCICSANGDCNSGVCAADATDYAIKAYNNIFTRFANGGIVLDNSQGGTDAEVRGVFLWNNTFWQDREDGFPGYADIVGPGGDPANWNWPAAAIKASGTGDSAAPITAMDDVDIRNNIFSDTALRGLHIGTGVTVTNATIDYNSYSNRDSEWTLSGKSACTFNQYPSPIKWGANCYGTDALATFQSDTGHEAHRQTTAPTFVNIASAPLDLGLAAADAGAKDLGTSLTTLFTTDYDGQTRSGTWDIGADEYAACHGQPGH